jgi:hypothetical protein
MTVAELLALYVALKPRRVGVPVFSLVEVQQ